MRPFLPNSTKHILPASASLAAMCSLSVLAASAVTLSALMAAKPAHATDEITGAYAIYGEIVIVVPKGTPLTRVQQAAANSNCEVAYAIGKKERYYVLRVKGLSRAQYQGKRSVPTTAGKTRKDIELIKKMPDTYRAPAPEVLQAVKALKQDMPGIGADPNWVRLPSAVPQTGNAIFQPVTPNDRFFVQQWDMQMINMPLAWGTQSSGNRTAIVSVIDDGFDASHPDFSRDGVPIFNQPISTANPPTVSTNILILGSHGTHCNGSVAAVANNEIGIAGVAGFDGGNVSVRLQPIQAGYFGVSTASYILSVEEAMNRGANVLSMSFGGYTYSDAEAAITADAIQAGLVLVAASANDNINMSLDLYNNNLIGQTDDQGNPAYGSPDQLPDQVYPAGYTGVISVNAVGPTKRKASYSNYGGVTNNFKVSAPGGDYAVNATSATDLILSTIPLQNFSSYVNGYDYMQGTSMACPHVAGMAGLLYAIGVETKDIPQTILDTAQAGVSNDPTLELGAGIIDVGNAVSTFDPLPRILLQGGTQITSTADTGVSRVTDMGPSYFRNVSFNVSVAGINRLLQAASADPASTSITVSIQLARNPERSLQTFTIPVSQITPLQSGESKVTVRNITVPSTPLNLAQERYKAVATVTYQGNVIDTQVQYFEVQDYTQPVGLTLFSVPFAPTVSSDGVQAESQVLGISSGYAMKRFDPLNPLGSGGDDAYFTFQPGVSGNSTYATFENKFHTGTSIPLSYGVSAPTVSLAPIGVGFWLNNSDSRRLDTTGTGATEPVAIPVFGVEDELGNFRGNGVDGWNLIGAPFPYPVNWNAVSIRQNTSTGVREYSLDEAVTNGLINAQLVGFDPQTRNYSYSVAPNGQLLPFRAYWIRALRDCTIVVPPTRAAQSAASRAASLIKSGRGEASQVPLSSGWRMRFAATVAGDRDAENYFGQTRGAKAGEDTFDIVKPPSGPSHAYVRFLNTNSRGKKSAYAFDMRPVQEGRMSDEWTVAVGSDKGDENVTLTWDGLGSLPRRAKLTLRDSVTGTVVPMNSRSSYTFKNTEAGATRQFTIALKTESTTGALQITNVRTSNASTGSTRGVSRGISVRFALNQDAEVQGVIRTLSGKVVSTLTGTSRAVGQGDTLLRWDGRSQEGATVPAGSYVVEISARNDNGESATVKRPVVILQ